MTILEFPFSVSNDLKLPGISCSAWNMHKTVKLSVDLANIIVLQTRSASQLQLIVVRDQARVHSIHEEAKSLITAGGRLSYFWVSILSHKHRQNPRRNVQLIHIIVNSSTNIAHNTFPS